MKQPQGPSFFSSLYPPLLHLVSFISLCTLELEDPSKFPANSHHLGEVILKGTDMSSSPTPTLSPPCRSRLLTRWSLSREGGSEEGHKGGERENACLAPFLQGCRREPGRSDYLQPGTANPSLRQDTGPWSSPLCITLGVSLIKTGCMTSKQLESITGQKFKSS